MYYLCFHLLVEDQLRCQAISRARAVMLDAALVLAHDSVFLDSVRIAVRTGSKPGVAPEWCAADPASGERI
ncbi:hypothetical protein ABID19_005953 [Mesorhizobium robiniae]|uniref:Uncharacterized protein n=1 Tax=Mesorhizobium robiniae TaxID=559315 RepID=A0ABV2GX69_9HYPH|nr:hypothetical protein [Mesorhizobium sp. ZC-5]MCV3243323.1 hypothetical protein [Mesorhizobium sp. ZC-5]